MDCDESMFLMEEDEILFQKIDKDLDLAFALSLQEELNEDDTNEALKAVVSTSSPSTKPLGIIDPQWELIDPNPDIHGLFIEFNTQFFYGKLGSVEVKWSPRMTLCAGLCCYQGRGGLCSVRLSLPLLKLRPRRDLIETLLHEMIHAYLFVTANNKDHNAHGPEFLSHMHRINKQTGTTISVYHSFHDEVDFQRKHWWKCDGPCQKRRPFYGIVKRAMNRSPGPNDTWWSQHQLSCGGKFTKIKEPENFKLKSQNRKQIQETKDQSSSADIKSFFLPSTSKSGTLNSSNSKRKREGTDIHTIKSVFAKEDNLVSVRDTDLRMPFPLASPVKKSKSPFSGKGFILGSSSSVPPTSLLSRIRKELGYPSSQATQQNSVLETAKPSAVIQANSSGSIKKSEVVSKGTLSTLAVSSNSLTTSNEKSKLKQSSLYQFVNSPLKTLEKQNDQKYDSYSTQEESGTTVACPVCSSFYPDLEINAHLDKCLLSTS